MVIKADALHYKTDVFSTLAVLISLLLVYFTGYEIIDALIDTSTGSAGVFTDWFLFASNCLRIVPPLTITKEEIETACNKLLAIL